MNYPLASTQPSYRDSSSIKVPLSGPLSAHARPSDHEQVNSVPIMSSPAAMFLAGFMSPPPPPPKDPAVDALAFGYTLGPIIGRGGFSTVHRASSINDGGGIVAVKIIKHAELKLASDQDRLMVDNEKRIWSSLSHEHILPLFSTHSTPDATFLFMLYCPAGTLLDILRCEQSGGRGLERDLVGTLFRQMARGLAYLHNTMHIIHGDLKLENVLVDDSGACRITDFGLAHKIQQEPSPTPLLLDSHVGSLPSSTPARLPIHLSLRRTNPLSRLATKPRSTSMNVPDIQTPPQHRFLPGSLPYTAPECLLPGTSFHPHPAQDIYALGCILHALLTGRLPFNDPFEPRLQMKIISGLWEDDSLTREDERPMLRYCLEKEREKRWTISQVDEAAYQVGASVEEEEERVERERMVEREQRIKARSMSRGRRLGAAASSSSSSAAAASSGIAEQLHAHATPPNQPPPPLLRASSTSRQRSTSRQSDVRHPLLRDRSRSQSHSHSTVPSLSPGGSRRPDDDEEDDEESERLLRTPIDEEHPFTFPTSTSRQRRATDSGSSTSSSRPRSHSRVRHARTRSVGVDKDKEGYEGQGQGLEIVGEEPTHGIDLDLDERRTRPRERVGLSGGARVRSTSRGLGSLTSLPYVGVERVVVDGRALGQSMISSVIAE